MQLGWLVRLSAAMPERRRPDGKPALGGASMGRTNRGVMVAGGGSGSERSAPDNVLMLIGACGILGQTLGRAKGLSSGSDAMLRSLAPEWDPSVA